jgi:hypothetical protein
MKTTELFISLREKAEAVQQPFCGPIHLDARHRSYIQVSWNNTL